MQKPVQVASFVLVRASVLEAVALPWSEQVRAMFKVGALP